MNSFDELWAKWTEKRDDLSTWYHSYVNLVAEKKWREKEKNQ